MTQDIHRDNSKILIACTCPHCGDYHRLTLREAFDHIQRLIVPVCLYSGKKYYLSCSELDLIGEILLTLAADREIVIYKRAVQ